MITVRIAAMKAMRRRIAVQKHFVRNPPNVRALFCAAFGVRTRPRVALSAIMVWLAVKFSGVGIWVSGLVTCGLAGIWHLGFETSRETLNEEQIT